MEIIAFCNQKGGVGKTTACFNTAVGLSDRGYKTLLVDADPQANATALCVNDMNKPGLLELMKKAEKREPSGREVVQSTEFGFDLIGGSLALASADREYVKAGREMLLKRGISEITTDYEYILIDTSPFLGILTENSLVVADRVVIPATPDMFSLVGLRQLLMTIDGIREDYNPALSVAGILISRVDRTNVTTAMIDTIKKIATENGVKVFNATIRAATAVRESQLLRNNLLAEYRKAGVAQDFEAFIDEL